MVANPTPREQLLTRLRRIEGQVRGLQRMLAEERDCPEVLTQLLATRSALDEVGRILLDGEIERCLGEGTEAKGRETLHRALRMWARLG